MKNILKLGCLSRPLGAEKQNGRICRNDRTRVRRKKVARILRREDERSIVLADPPREVDDETADGWIVEEQTELVDHQHAAAVSPLDPRPESLGEEEVNRCDHLVA